MNAQEQIADLLKITSRLVGLLEREIEILRALKPAEIEALQREKIALTAAYESRVKSLESRPDLLGTVQPVLKDELERAIGRFQSTLGANESALRAAKDTTQRVLKAIADEIIRARSENKGYSAGGYGASYSRAGPGQPVSVAIDERL